MNFRDEFRWKKLGFSQAVPLQRFFIFHWRLPGLSYVVYRVIAALYCLSWLIYAFATDSNKFLPEAAFLTIWTYTLETTYFMVHAVFAIYFYFFSWQRNSVSLVVRMSEEEHCAAFPELNLNENETEQRIYSQVPSDTEDDLIEPSYNIARSRYPRWYAVILWILFNCLSSAAIMVTIVFWGVLVPFDTHLDNMSLGNIQLHLVNTILLFIEHSMSAIPIHVLHVIFPIVYGIIYLTFSVFYWVDDHSHVMYKILDWNKPIPTLGYTLAVGFIIIPIIHLLFYCIYRVKLRILKNVYN